MKNSKIITIAALMLAGMLALCGCGSNGNSAKSADKPASSEQKADDKGEDKGFEEVPVGPHQDQNIGPLTIGAVYFQPVDMVPAGMGLKASEASFHLEADIHANKEGTKLVRASLFQI